MEKLLFRANADLKSGTGDLLSLIYLSEHFASQEKVFVVNETKESRDILEENGITNVIYLPDFEEMKEEVEWINSLIRQNEIDILFLEITSKDILPYKNAMVPYKVCINFDGIIPKNMDLVINWDIGSAGLYDREKCPNTRFLLGPEFVVLKKEITDKSCQLKGERTEDREAETVLISFGGFDEFNFTIEIIKALEAIDDKLKLNIILGAGYSQEERLQVFLEKSRFTGYRVQRNIKYMMKEFLDTDLAIISGGLSLFEALSLKVPVAAIATYEHQIERCEFFEKKGFMKYLGFRQYDTEKLEKAVLGDTFLHFNKKLLVGKIPEMIHEGFSCKA